MSSIIRATTTSGLQVAPDNSGSLQLQTNGTTAAVTIDTSQNVGIGTTSSTQKLSINSSGTSVNSLISFKQADTEYMQVGMGADNNAYLLTTSRPMLFYLNGAERMRIDSSGNVLIGTTSQTYGEKLNIQNSGASGNGALFYYTSTEDRGNILVRHARASGATNAPMMQFLNSSGTGVGTINSTGSATSYGTSSDYRLKENIVPMTGALDKVAQLKPSNWTWKSTGENGQGFIAHELQSIVPDCVTGEKDDIDEDGNPKYQGVDTSFLVATLTAAIQEQQAIINDLKARIETLEAK